MRVYVLADNNEGDGLRGEWGLSFYIEYSGMTVLLDAGRTSLFAVNAEEMKLDLDKVDLAVLSHAHNDHANGMDMFFELNDHAPLYVARECGENCYDRTGLFYHYVGITRGLMKRHAGRIVKADGDMMIADGIRLLGHTTPGLEKQGIMEKMYLKQGFMRYVPDDYRHEQSLVFEMDDGVVIFNSCSHAGADNIINEVMQVYPGKMIKAMIGGFHLFNKSDDYVRAFARRLEQTGAESIYTGHCTGDRAFEVMREELGDKVHAFRTGLVFEIV
jgi:7,8-dihydropterin-6-yl-methyl-4-(beta-D-ribofuranosyl)aminobenzene 5'-phosphate synthase